MAFAVTKLNNYAFEKLNELKKIIEEHKKKFSNYTCPICNFNSYKIILKKDRYNLDLNTGLCKKCGLLQYYPKLSKDFYKIFYTEFYQEIYKGKNPNNIFDYNKSQKKGKEFWKLITNYINLNKDELILEIGCGDGKIIKYFTENGYECAGLDFSEAINNKYNLNLLNIKNGNIYTFNHLKKPALIIYNRVLEHIADIESELNEITKKIKKNGYLYISVPGIYSIKNTLNIKKLYLQKYFHYAHIYHFSLDSLKNLMYKFGFDLIYGNESIDSIWKYTGEKKHYVSVYIKNLIYLKKLKYFKHFYYILNYIKFFQIKFLKFIKKKLLFIFLKNN